MIKNNIVTYAATVGGACLVLVALLGLCFPNFLGLHLTPTLSLVHLASGIVALYFGLSSTTLAAGRSFCQAIGLFYTVAGLVGFVAGGLGYSLAHVLVGVGFITAARMQTLPSSVSLRR